MNLAFLVMEYLSWVTKLKGPIIELSENWELSSVIDVEHIHPEIRFIRPKFGKDKKVWQKAVVMLLTKAGRGTVKGWVYL